MQGTEEGSWVSMAAFLGRRPLGASGCCSCKWVFEEKPKFEKIHQRWSRNLGIIVNCQGKKMKKRKKVR
jgi:uncharacterized lipoprotein NlpE involved in copper resistance